LSWICRNPWRMYFDESQTKSHEVHSSLFFWLNLVSHKHKWWVQDSPRQVISIFVSFITYNVIKIYMYHFIIYYGILLFEIKLPHIHLVDIYLRAPDKLRICVFYAMKTSKNACIIRSECTFMHTCCCVSKLSKFGAYL
jgi:hypothetical protein